MAALYQVATELAGECQDVTLILDKGNNSKKNILRLSDAIGFVGSLVPSHHPELLAVPKTEFVPLEGSQFGGVLAYRTKKEVFGAKRTVVVTYNEALYLGQMQGLVISMRKANERLRELKRALTNAIPGGRREAKSHGYRSESRGEKDPGQSPGRDHKVGGHRKGRGHQPGV
ncbi:MAG: hypothetical protein HPY52_10325 [Firmicutes bacterium]|nr:hypothetical protein [Bacillota bacterium]